MKTPSVAVWFAKAGLKTGSSLTSPTTNVISLAELPLSGVLLSRAMKVTVVLPTWLALGVQVKYACC